jgi:hypothetical protein
LRQLEGRSDDGAFQTKGLPNKAKAAEPGTPGGYNTGADVVMSDKKKRKADADPETPASGKKEKKVRSPFAVAPCAFYPRLLSTHRLTSTHRRTRQEKKEKSAKKSEKKEKKEKKSKKGD